MEPLTAEEVLQLWERGEQLRPPARTLVLLARARKGVSADLLEGMTIGESEVTLLELRTTTLGGDLRGIDACPDCRTLVELALDAAWLIGPGAARGPDLGQDAASAPRQVAVSADGWQLRFRLPTVGDLAVLAEEADPAQARARLLERCLQEARTPEGAGATAADLPPALQARVAKAMDEADPAAQLATPVKCPDCGRVWQAAIDVAAFFWRELAVMARRLLGEVDELASRYGWSEREILRLSAVRRHAYIERRWA